MARTPIRGSILALLCLVTGCASPAAPPKQTPGAAVSSPAASSAAVQAPLPPKPEKLAADTPKTTAGGAAFTAPAGFTLTQDGLVIRIDPPETDFHAAVVEVRAANLDTAVSAAWKAVRPDFSRSIKERVRMPPRFGWDERQRIYYESSPSEHTKVFALSLRRGDSWTFYLVEGSLATWEKRYSPFMLVDGSLRPKGYVRESFAGKKAHALDGDRLKKLSEFIEHGMKELGIPGAAYGLIQDGKVVFAQGFGVRELGKPAKVDADTLFMIASTTKALTTLLLAKLVDEGKFAWDTPVTQVYPGFKLGDPDATRRLLMKHVVCACTGVPAQDFEWWYESSRATPKSMVELLATIRPTSRFGEVFQYSNLMAAAAGYVGAHTLYPDRELGAAYDEAMKTRVFGPLGMKTATFDFGRAERGNHASPHGDNQEGKPVVASLVPLRATLSLRPSGGAWASVRDELQYLQVELSRGKLPDGTRHVSERNIVERRVSQIALGEDEDYGMGLSTNRAWGIPVVNHDGGLPGFKSYFYFLPDHGVGGVFLTNSVTGYILLEPLLRRLVEVLFDGAPEAEEDLAAGVERLRSRQAALRARLTVPADPKVIAGLATRYKNPALGEVTLKKRGSATIVDVGEWTVEVATRKNGDGTVSLFGIEPGIDDEFLIGQRDGKRVLIVQENQHEYVFVENP